MTAQGVRIENVVALGALAMALAGAGVAGYLAVENLQGDTGVCVGVHGCATVQDSRYGELLVAVRDSEERVRFLGSVGPRRRTGWGRRGTGIPRRRGRRRAIT